MKIYFIILLCIFSISCTEQKLSELHFLEGNWQVEGKQQFEKWEKNGNELIGVGYKLENEEEKTLETLAIKLIDGKVIYQAKVVGQNKGESIHFCLNDTLTDCFSFENSDHDFPNKIQYRIIKSDQLKVNVLGDDGKGFNFFLNKVETR